MNFLRTGWLCLCVYVWYCSAATPRQASPAAGIELPLDIRADGSYKFAYSTGDTGRHYHSATASPDNTVTGVFGYKDPKTGRDLQTKYSAGKRGFRANGPHIARRMDLSQNKIPYHPPVSPDSSQYNPTYSGYHDPNEDPTYSFEFHTPTHSRKEDSDYKADVNGRYSFVDDVGMRHVVEYEAGSRTGFHVKNAYPDSSPLGGGVFYAGPPANRKSSKPLRGHTAIQRGKDGSYSFTAVGPDQRRTEVSDSTGHVKGFYTYVDDKGVQRTTQYIAGPNIGYKIISSHTNDKYPVLPYPPSYPPFLPTPEDNDGGVFGTGPGGAGGAGGKPPFGLGTDVSGGDGKPSFVPDPDVSGAGGKPPHGSIPDGGGTGGKPPGGSGIKPPGGITDPWPGATPGSSSTPPIPGSSGNGGFDDLFGPDTGGGSTGNDGEDYGNDHGYEYEVPDPDSGTFLIPQPSTPSNIPYGNCCKLAPKRPAQEIKSSSRPSRHQEQYVGFPSGVPIRARVQSLDIRTYGSRLPNPGAAIDLPVPPKSRRGAEYDEPDYWSIKLRRHSRLEDQKETQDSINMKPSRTARHSKLHDHQISGEREGELESRYPRTFSRNVRHSKYHDQEVENSEQNQPSTLSTGNSELQQEQHSGVAESEEVQDILKLKTNSHSVNHSELQRHPEENQDTTNLQPSSARHSKLREHQPVEEREVKLESSYLRTFSRNARHSKYHDQSVVENSEQNQDTTEMQPVENSELQQQQHSGIMETEETQDKLKFETNSHSINHSELQRNPEENQDIVKLQPSSRSARHSKLTGHLKVEQEAEAQNTVHLQSTSVSEQTPIVPEAGEIEEKQDLHNLNSSESTNNSEVHENIDDPQENPHVHNLNSSSELTKRLEVHEIQTDEPEENQNVPSLQQSLESTNNWEVHDDFQERKPDENQNTHNLQISSESTGHSEVLRNLEAGETEERQDIRKIKKPSRRFSEVHRQSVKGQPEENKDSQTIALHRHRLEVTY